MLQIPLKQLPKAEIVWRLTHYCKHRHNFIEHPTCFAGRQEERIGFLDIEASNLHADFGYVFSYAIRTTDGNTLGRVLTPHEIKTFVFDKYLLKECIADLRKFDRLIGFYSKNRRFDIPFLRTRALYHNTDFPGPGEILFTDVYDFARNQLKFHSNRLQVLCEFFGIPAKEHPITKDIWIRASAGDLKSLKWIWTHNVEDVVSLDLIYNKILRLLKLTKTSI